MNGESYNITVRMPTETARQLRQLAEDEQRSINAQIVVLIQRAVTQQRLESEPRSLGLGIADARQPVSPTRFSEHVEGAH